jgi:hypothetical protein
MSLEVRSFVASTNVSTPFVPAFMNQGHTTARHYRSVFHMGWFPYLFDVLEQVRPARNGQKRLVEDCRQLFHDDAARLRIINEFDESLTERYENRIQNTFSFFISLSTIYVNS